LYKRFIFHPLYLISIVLVLTTGKTSILFQVGIYSLALFAVTMILHGELVRLKPSYRYLTSFYLILAGGGALGGVFVALVAPLIFPSFWEFQLCLFGTGILLVISLLYDKNSWFHEGSSWVPIIITAGIAAAFEASLHLFPSLSDALSEKSYFRICFGAVGLLALWPVVNKRGSRYRGRWIKGYAFAAMIMVGGACILHAQSQVAGSVARFRSFFGVIRIYKEESNLILKHGQTIHGWQIQDGMYDSTPTCYYATNTGIGILLRNHRKQKMSGPESELRVGIVGLGTGTLAAYGRTQDYYRFYEIDPEIAGISHGSRAMFTFLQLSAAKTEIVIGDGRLSMEHEAKRGDLGRFDLLVLDAFSSDSIPTHLLTRQAMEVYLRHLRGDDSVVAFHITNHILDLSPIILGLSREFGMDMIIVHNSRGNISTESRWVFLSRDPEALSIPQWDGLAMRPYERAESILWTDNYSNLYKIVMNWTG
jgi:spermidine synthase